MVFVRDIVIVVICIIADVVTGLTAAWLTQTFSSSKMRIGAQHKIGEILSVVSMVGVQYGLPYLDVHTSINFVRYITIYIVIMELTSIAENIVELDPEMSGPFGKIIDMLKGVFDNGRNS